VLSDRVAAFTDDDNQMLQLLAGFIATAMHNAASYERSQVQALHDPLTGCPTGRCSPIASSTRWPSSSAAPRGWRCCTSTSTTSSR
jgi:hypothetical protein